MRNRACSLIFGTVALGAPSSAIAYDAVTYSYDALGRLVSTNVSGGPNAGVTTGTSFDPAGNRTSFTVSGAASARGVAASRTQPQQNTRTQPISGSRP